MLKFFFSEHAYMMRFSEWLRTHRKVAKISQETLAERVTGLGYPITGAQISNYEREYDKDQNGNPTRPKEKFVELAAHLLGRPLNEALQAAGYAPKIAKAKPPAAILEKDFSGFDTRDIEEISNFIDFKIITKQSPGALEKLTKIKDTDRHSIKYNNNPGGASVKQVPHGEVDVADTLHVGDEQGRKAS